jgi:hypothetical protein
MMKLIATSVLENKTTQIPICSPLKNIKIYHMVPIGYHGKPPQKILSHCSHWISQEKMKKKKNWEDAPLLGCYPRAELYPILSHFVHKNLIGRRYKGPSKYLPN